MGQFAVLGCGEFGITVARELHAGGHEVLCLDKERDRVQRVSEWANQAVIADVTDRAALATLALDEVDAVVIAIGEHLEASVLATLYVRELGAKRIIAKASSDDQAKVLRALGVEEVVSPEHEMGRKLALSLMVPNVVDFIPLQRGVSIREIAPPEDFLGRSIAELDIRRRHNIEIVAIRDASTKRVEVLPRPDLVLEANDRLIVLGNDKDLDRLGT